MAFIVPNAGQTGGASTYINVNQAEPDSLDFEIVGNRSSWVRSGGNISSVSSTQVVVSGGIVVIQGIPYTFNTTTLTIPNCTTSDVSRFDAIVARLSGSTVTVVRVSGLESGANPTLPQSRSTLGSQSFLSAYHVDFATDVVLYTVYKDGTIGLAASGVVDKRVVDNRPITYEASSIPTESTPGVVGDRRLVGGVPYTYVTSTPAAGESPWRSEEREAGSVTDFSPPVGSIIGWAGVSSPSDRYIPCDGRTLSKTLYPALWDAIQYKYGGSGDSFVIPNISDDRTIYGVSNTATSFGVSGGNNSVKLTESHIPSHRHTLKTNGLDNTHNPHYHEFECVQAGEIGGSKYPLLAKVENDVPTKGNIIKRRVNDNHIGLQHSPEMGYYGFPSSSQAAIDLRGKYINLSWYIRIQ